MESPKDVVFYHEQYGDLCLLVDPDEQAHIVCSRILSRHSPVFKAMLRGRNRWAESQPEQREWIVKLPADNPDVMAGLFSLAHRPLCKIKDKFRSQMKKPQWLWQLCQLGEKYQAHQLMVPFVKDWFDKLCRKELASPGGKPHCVEMASIA
jgi:hypothetical protein